MRFLLRLLLHVIVVLLISHFLPFVKLDDISTAFKLVVVLSLLNFLLKPLLVLLTIPVTIITLGLFLLIINGIIILVADYFLDGFHVTSGILGGVILSLLLSVVNSIVDSFLVK